MANFGIRYSCETDNLMSFSSSVMTLAAETSLPEPAVVGTAINGRDGFSTVLLPPKRYSLTEPSLVMSMHMALAVSITLPPPTATHTSQPLSFSTCAAASQTSIGGSGCVSVKSCTEYPFSSNDAMILANSSVLPTCFPVTKNGFFTPISSNISYN